MVRLLAEGRIAVMNRKFEGLSRQVLVHLIFEIPIHFPPLGIGFTKQSGVIRQLCCNFSPRSEASFLSTSEASFLSTSEASFLSTSEASFLSTSEASFLSTSERSECF